MQICPKLPTTQLHQTEELVEQLINDRKTKLTDSTILDIGTGSGCISIAIKKNWPAAKVIGLDINKDALAIAKENAAKYNAHIQFTEMDFLDESTWMSLPIFNIIISNPPYIPIKEKDNINKTVIDFEPHIALFVPDNTPLIFYEKIAKFGSTHLLPTGKIDF